MATAHKANKALTAESPINPKTGRVWSLVDPEVQGGVDALKTELRNDPAKAKAFLEKAGFLSARTGKLTKRYGG